MSPDVDSSLCVPIPLSLVEIAASGMEIGHGPLIPDAVPIMMPPAELAVTLEYCVDDIDLIAKDIIDG